MFYTRILPPTTREVMLRIWYSVTGRHREDLPCILDMLHQWCHSAATTINLDKSKAVYFNKGHIYLQGRPFGFC